MTDAPDTLGARMGRAARRLARRRAPRPAWLPGLERVLERMADRDRLPATRYERRETAPPLSRPEPEQDTVEPLPGDVRLALRPVAGTAVDVARTHTGELADRIARAGKADAVTVGRDVFFRGGRLEPRTDAGAALLVHELAHVSAFVGRAPGRRETAAAIRTEEAQAQQRERAYLGRLRPAPAPAPAPAMPPALLPGPAPAARPQAPAGPARAMAAPEDRPLQPEAPAPAAPPLDVAQLQRALFQGLRAELRAELERGG
jgi:hypothetical protein